MLVRRSRSLGFAVVAGMLGIGPAAQATDDELPDVEFLEYLGSWEESDEDWLIVDRIGRAREELDNEKRSDPAPNGEESSETDNER